MKTSMGVVSLTKWQKTDEQRCQAMGKKKRKGTFTTMHEK